MGGCCMENVASQQVSKDGKRGPRRKNGVKFFHAFIPEASSYP